MPENLAIVSFNTLIDHTHAVQGAIIGVTKST